jgi:ligand-binding sensor domain-containing protein/two-component sensor histidine kinase
MRKFIWLSQATLAVVIAIYSSLSLLAQNHSLTLHQIADKEELPSSERYFLSQDSYGYQWIGTDEGLLRFDGQKLKRYNPDNNTAFTSITSECYEDTEGNLWFSSDVALHCYRRAMDDFVSFHPQTSTNDFQVFHLDTTGQSIWLRVGQGSKGSIYWFDRRTSTFKQGFPLEGKEFHLVKNNRGVPIQLLSLRLPNKPGFYVTNLLTEERHHLEFDRLLNGTVRNYSGPTKGIYQDAKGNCWIGVYDGIGLYQPNTGAYGVINTRSLDIVDDLEWVNDIALFQGQEVLVTTSKGLFIFDTGLQSFTRKLPKTMEKYTHFSDKNLTSINRSANGTLMVFSEDGIAYFGHIGKHKFAEIPVLNGKAIHSIALDKTNHIWCSTEKDGTYIFDQSGKLQSHHELMINDFWTSGYSELFGLDNFIAINDEWWAQAGNILFPWRNKEQDFEYLEENFFGVDNGPEDRFNFFCLQMDQRLLGSFGRSIYQIDLLKGRSDTIRLAEFDFLNLGIINIIFESAAGDLFIGDRNGRMVILTPNGDGWKKLKDYPGFGVCNALVPDPKRNILWCINKKGLRKISLTDFSYTNAFDEVPAEKLLAGKLDDSGNLWITSSNGLIRYVPETLSFQSFGQADGLLSTAYARNACLSVPSTGEIWVGGRNGVNVFHPKDIKLSDFKPNISIAELLVNDNPFQPKREENKGNLNEKESLTFNYQDNTLSFRFVALDYSDPEANEYYYQMEGYDDKRVYAGTRNFVRYPNLPAGDYTFKVWATNSDKVLNEVPKVLSLIIIPPIYQRWWFYLLCLIVISAIMYAIFQYRLEQALKVERLRVKISSDLHDDVGGMLSGLAMQTELLELTANEERKPKLARVAEMSRTAMSRMRDTVWAIDARKDTLADLVDRMREHAEETLPSRNIQHAINVNRLELDRVLATDVRQSLYLIYKEAITNTAKHSNGDTVNVDLTRGETDFTMSIHDNGTVIAKGYKTTGAGQSNMRMRAASIGATLTVITDDGYRIILKRKSL